MTCAEISGWASLSDKRKCFQKILLSSFILILNGMAKSLIALKATRTIGV